MTRRQSSPRASDSQIHKAKWLAWSTRIGDRISRRALWTDTECTWTIAKLDRSDLKARGALFQPTTGEVYTGTSGIALYLAELYAQTGDAAFRRTGLGALRFAARYSESLPALSFGFHGGRVGIAYALWKGSRLFEQSSLREEAERVLNPLVPLARYVRPFDVIGGAAGAIPALLLMAEDIDPRLTLDLAVQLGETLVEHARPEPVGWSWDPHHRAACVRNPCGMAHGASGIGHGLQELFATTGEARFGDAALEAFCYEQQFFDVANANWPDFRFSALAELFAEGREQHLREAVAQGMEAPTWELTYPVSWCHGAPGITLTRTRAQTVFGCDALGAQARAAVPALSAALGGEHSDFSLCHGAAGSAEALLDAAHLLDTPVEVTCYVDEIMSASVHQFEAPGRHWPTGTHLDEFDPTLMLGEAGIGLHFLRRADPSVPSVLRLDTTPNGPAALRGEAEAADLRRASVDAWWKTSLDVLQTIDGKRLSIESRSTTSAPAAAFDLIQQRISGEADAGLRTSLEDAISPEKRRYLVARDRLDDTSALVSATLRPPAEERPWVGSRMTLTEGVELTETLADWQAWSNNGGHPTLPEVNPSYHVSFLDGPDAHLTRLEPFAYLVLSYLRDGATLDELLASVTRQLPPVIPPDQLKERVEAQVLAAYKAGLIRMISSPAGRFSKKSVTLSQVGEER